MAIRNMRDAQSRGIAPDMEAIADYALAEEEFGETDFAEDGFFGLGYSDDLLKTQLQEMNKGKKYGGLFKSKDSAEYTRVKTALERIVYGMEEPFTEDAGNNERILRNVSLEYMNLVRACQIYLKKGDGITKTGRARRERISMILELAKRDLHGVQNIIFNTKYIEPGAMENLSWKDILRDARYETLKVDDLMSKEEFGGIAKTEENAGRILEQGMFSKESIIDEISLQNNAWTEYYGIEKANKPEGMNRWGLRSDNKINHSNRNIATSRLANLLGLGNIVENSQKVRVEDEKTGEIHNGILMTKAKGVRSDLVEEESMAITKKMKNINHRHAYATRNMTHAIQKDLTSLQVFDYICGQADRNHGNFFLEQNGVGQFIGVHGIDNDMAFMNGVNTENVIRKNGAQSMNRGRMVVDDSENLTIPHMDEQLAQNILDLSTDEVRFALQDVIEPEFIDPVIQRLVRMKHAIQKEMTKQSQGESNVFVREGGWNDKTHWDLMKQSIAFKEFQNRLQAEGKQGTDDAYFNKAIDGFTDISDRGYELIKNDTYYARLIYTSMGYKLGGPDSGDKYVYEGE